MSPSLERAAPEVRWRKAAKAGRILLICQWCLLLLAVLVAGAVLHPVPSLPRGIEKAAWNQHLYGGWVPNPDPLGARLSGYNGREEYLPGENMVAVLLMGLSRSLLGPLVSCLVAALLGGLWGCWAGFTEGASDRFLTAMALCLEGIPRIVLYALLGRVLLLVRSVHFDLLSLTFVFGLLQTPVIALALRNHVRSVVREGHIEGLVSLGFRRRTIVIRDLLLRHCQPLLRLQYVARVTELVALETAISFALGGSDTRSIGWALRRLAGVNLRPGSYEFILILSLTLYLVTFSALARWNGWDRGRASAAAPAMPEVQAA